MSEQNRKQVATLQRPTTRDPEAWQAYWETQEQPWRTEPEIDAERQKYLAERRSIKPDIEKGIYPFRGTKLSRADVEWLLATHENGRGPVDWSDENQRQRAGLDLRGADLIQADLERLPLSNLYGGLDRSQWCKATKQQSNMAAVILREANLREAHLERATLRRAFLEDAFLLEAHLEQADLTSAHLEGTNFYQAHLEGASLRRAFFDIGSFFYEVFLGNEKMGWVSVLDTRWGNANLSTVKWSHVELLGEEYGARQKMRGNRLKNRVTRLEEFQEAVRASRQLAAVVQAQGLTEEAAYFAYRAQKLQCIVLRLQRKFGAYLFSLFLDLLAGYGYRPGRSVLWYLIIIVGFAFAYHFLGGLSLYPPDAVIFSIMSFHGRGFFPNLSSETNLHNPLVMLAAAEAIVGLLIEISFIATFTQRFFGK